MSTDLVRISVWIERTTRDEIAVVAKRRGRSLHRMAGDLLDTLVADKLIDAVIDKE